jgi:uncharacterized DUF497 family protein
VFEAVAGFDWDEGNRAKCVRHGVTIAAIESLFESTIAVLPDPAHSRIEVRYKAIGKAANGRSVLIVFTLRTHEGETLIRPISARYMHKKEVAYYEETTAGPGE